MGRLIDADAFSAFLKDAVIKQKYDRLSIDNALTVADVLQAVCAELDGAGLEGFKNAPTVDAVPVVHGRWINEGVYGEGHSQCSIRCSNPLCNFHYIGYLDDYNYCPNCGAKMDGKDGDADGV